MIGFKCLFEAVACFVCPFPPLLFQYFPLGGVEYRFVNFRFYIMSGKFFGAVQLCFRNFGIRKYVYPKQCHNNSKYVCLGFFFVRFYEMHGLLSGDLEKSFRFCLFIQFASCRIWARSLCRCRLLILFPPQRVCCRGFVL